MSANSYLWEFIFSQYYLDVQDGLCSDTLVCLQQCLCMYVVCVSVRDGGGGLVVGSLDLYFYKSNLTLCCKIYVANYIILSKFKKLYKSSVVKISNWSQSFGVFFTFCSFVSHFLLQKVSFYKSLNTLRNMQKYRAKI